MMSVLDKLTRLVKDDRESKGSLVTKVWFSMLGASWNRARRRVHVGRAAVSATLIASVLALTVPAGAVIWGGPVVLPTTPGAGVNTWNLLADQSCVSIGNCVAVGANFPDATASNVIRPILVVETNGVWATPVIVVAPSGSSSTEQALLDAVSCSSAGNCVAVGSFVAGTLGSKLPFAISEVSGVWGTPKPLPLPSGAYASTTKTAAQSAASQSGLSAVSCPADQSCVAVGTVAIGSSSDNYNVGLTEVLSTGQWTAGTVSASSSTPAESTTTGGQSGLGAVSCSSATDCTAVGAYFAKSGYQWDATTLSGAGWSTPVALSQPAGSVAQTSAKSSTFPTLNALACTSDGNCVATGAYDVTGNGSVPSVVTETSGTWSKGQALALPSGAFTNSAKTPQNSGAGSVACVSVGNCVATGAYGAVYDSSQDSLKPAIWTETSGTWSAGVTAPLPASAYGPFQFSDAAGASCTTSLLGECSFVGYFLTVSATGEAVKMMSISATTVPSAPTSVTATGYNQSAVVSWTAPTATGGQRITGYTATASPGGATCTTTATHCTVSGLSNDTAYTFTVKATNINGDSVASSPSSETSLFAVPGASTNVKVVPGNKTATVSWTAPTSNGTPAISSVVVTATPGGATCSPAQLSATSCVVSGLTNGTTYSFTVVASNTNGGGVPSNAVTATPATVPTPPSITKVTPSKTSATVLVHAPSNNGGSVITSYQYAVTPGVWKTATTSGTASASPVITVNFLSSKTKYHLTIRAVNAAGVSPSSATANFTTL